MKIERIVPGKLFLQGDPAELLEMWQEKLALKLNEETGKIEPLYQ